MPDDDLPLLLIGTDNSPWSQAAAMALHLKGLRFATSAAPPLSLFQRRGFTIPSLWHGSSLISGSDNIVAYLDARFPAAGPKLATPPSGEWVYRGEELFIRYAFGRVAPPGSPWSPGGVWSFFVTWSRKRDLGDRLLAKAFFRALPACNFGLLLLLSRHWFGLRMHLGRVRQSLAWWTERLREGGGAYMCGEEVSAADLILFGQIQCMASSAGTTRGALLLLREQPELLRWARAMNARLGGYPWLHTRCLERDDTATWGATPPPTTAAERACFFAGLALFLTALLPLTLAAVGYHTVVRRRDPNRSYKKFFEERAARRANEIRQSCNTQIPS